MDNPFFERPILNSPSAYPSRYWELDEQGQPTWLLRGLRPKYRTIADFRIRRRSLRRHVRGAPKRSANEKR